MDATTRVRLQAAHWVIRLGRLFWVLTVAAAAWSLLGAVVFWSGVQLVLSAVLAGLAAGWGALVLGLERHSLGAWRGLLAAQGIALIWTAGACLAASRVGMLDVFWVGESLVFSWLLLHPDSREWVRPDPPAPSPHGGAPACSPVRRLGTVTASRGTRMVDDDHLDGGTGGAS